MSESRYLGEVAWRLRTLSSDVWGPDRALEMVGLSPAFLELQGKLEKIASYDEPVLILGESGSGKDFFARALYLLSRRRGQAFVSVNCPQYQDGNLTVSELFGHRKGSFTGATEDRRGAFETANGGVIFLDEIGDLHMGAQVMLLRTLATGELQPLGSDLTRRVDVRVIAATNRSLHKLIHESQFRNDLFFRLRYFVLAVPPLRERGEDWRLLLDFFLERAAAKYGAKKSLSERALKLLSGYDWPGNVRQVHGVAASGYALTEGTLIEPESFLGQLDVAPGGGLPGSVDALYDRIVVDGEDFWSVVHRAFLDRDLNREQVRRIVGRGLLASEGSYRRLLEVLRVPAGDYQRFMDFLRHHDLKP